jgi:hypothetical protein
MSLRQERYQLPVPVMGVRKDVSRIVSTPEMLQDGINVMVWDQTLRPRPASTREYFGEVATAWKNISPTDGSDTLAVHGFTIWNVWDGSAWDGTCIIAHCGDVEGTAAGSLEFKYSEDEGETWSDCVVAGNAPEDSTTTALRPTFPIVRMHALYAWDAGSGQYIPQWLVALEGASHIRGGKQSATDVTGGNFFWCDISNFHVDHTLTWKSSQSDITDLVSAARGMTLQQVSGALPPVIPPARKTPVMTPFSRSATCYGVPSSVTLGPMLAAQPAGFPGEDKSIYADLDIFVLGDIAGLDAGTSAVIRQCIHDSFDGNLTAEDWLSWKDFYMTSGESARGFVMSRRPDSSQALYSNTLWEWDDGNYTGTDPLTSATPTEWTPVDDPTGEIRNASMNINGQVMVTRPTKLERYNTDGSYLDLLIGDVPSADFKLSTINETSTEGYVVGSDIWHGETYMTADTLQSEDLPFPTDQLAHFQASRTVIPNTPPVLLVQQCDPDNVNSCFLWRAPLEYYEQDEGITDDLTGIAQGNMDTEKYAFFGGTTRRLLKLNRGTNGWDDITPRYLFTDGWTLDSPDVYYTTCNLDPDTVWYDGAIGTRRTSKPTTGDPEGHWWFDQSTLRLYLRSDGTDPDTAYTSPGVEGRYGQIIGTFSDNRWTFRFVEKGNNKFLIGTNGDQPVAFNDGYSRARLVGDADNSGAIDGDEVLPPKAKCMAVANNRLVLCNLPDLSPFGCVFSDPIDFDAGYDNPVLLADTQGAIVAARELTAITIAIIKEDAIYHGISQAEFMGVSAPMRFELIKTGISGPCSDASVLYLPDGRLCWLGRDGGVYAYDGVAPVDMGRHIRHLIQAEIDPERFDEVTGMVDPVKNLLWFFYPTTTGEPGNLNRGIVCSIDQGEPWPTYQVQYPTDWVIAAGIHAFFFSDRTYSSFGTPSSGARWGDFPTQAYSSFERGYFGMVFARKNNTWYTQLWGAEPGMYNDFGTSMRVLWEHGGNDFGDMLRFKTVHEIHHNWDIDGFDLFTTTLTSQRYSPRDLSESSQEIDYSSYRMRNTFRQSGTKHWIKVEGDIDNMFNWGGANVLFSNRGLR